MLPNRLIIILGALISVVFTNGSKISPKVTRALAANNQTSVIIHYNEPFNTKIQETVKSITKHAALSSTTRTVTTCSELNKLINQHQGLILNAIITLTTLLDQLKIQYKCFWMALVCHIPKATLPIISELAELDIVVTIRMEEVLPKSPVELSKPAPKPSEQISWNLDLIDARCDNIDCYGKGVLVGILDTGVLWDHEQLKDNFQNDDYSWWNPYSITFSRLPEDNAGHGTHVAGIAVGATIGVAFNASWMACKGCEEDECLESALLECMHFMATPWRWDDSTPNKDTKDVCKRPHIVNNSWGGSSGSQTMYPSQQSYYKVIEYWNLLGILSVFSAGNTGPGCASLGYPGSFQNTLSIGAVDNKVTIAYFSSRGPGIMGEDFTPNSVSSQGGSCILPPKFEQCTNATLAEQQICQYIKPDVVAPGVNVLSSWYTDVSDYQTLSGTSMSAPHVTGIIALMLCKDLSLRWDFTNVYKIVRESTTVSKIDLKGEGKNVSKGNFAKGSNILCNFVTSGICNDYPVYPNNLYGKGLVNACNAVVETSKMLPSG